MVSTTFHDLLDAELCRVEHLYEEGIRFALPTGLSGWDITTRGLRRSALHVLSGPHGSEVTSLATPLAESAACRFCQCVVVVSNDLPGSEFARRTGADRARVPIGRLETERISGDRGLMTLRAISSRRVSQVPQQPTQMSRCGSWRESSPMVAPRRRGRRLRGDRGSRARPYRPSPRWDAGCARAGTTPRPPRRRRTRQGARS